MDLRQFRHLLAVAEAGNFHRAAEALNMAQPPLSVSIRKLEEELGVRLVDRHSRGVTLTPQGHRAVAQATRILRDAENLRSLARDSVAGIGGTLNVGFVGSATYRVIPAVVPAFRRRFPRVELRLREITSLDIIKNLVRGDLDVGLARTPLFDVIGVRLTTLASENLVLAVPYGHAFESRSEVDISELRHEPMILYERDAAPSFRALVDLKFNVAGIIPNVVEEASRVHTMVALVECGIGAALVPSFLRKTGAGRVRLVDITCEGEPIEIDFAAVVRAGEDRRLIANFVAVAAEALKDVA